MIEKLFRLTNPNKHNIKTYAYFNNLLIRSHSNIYTNFVHYACFLNIRRSVNQQAHVHSQKKKELSRTKIGSSANALLEPLKNL